MTLLERGDVQFSRWRSRNIRSEFYRLRLTVPHTSEGRYTGRNFLFESDMFGTHFRARFAANRLRLFVPSACLERVRPGRRGDEVRPRVEDTPWISPHELVDRAESRRRWNSVIFTHEMECGANVRIRFYDFAAERRRAQRLNGETVSSTVPHNYLTGVTIYRAAD